MSSGPRLVRATRRDLVNAVPQAPYRRNARSTTILAFCTIGILNLLHVARIEKIIPPAIRLSQVVKLMRIVYRETNVQRYQPSRQQTTTASRCSTAAFDYD
jgi:hypothetical protein